MMVWIGYSNLYNYPEMAELLQAVWNYCNCRIWFFQFLCAYIESYRHIHVYTATTKKMEKYFTAVLVGIYLPSIIHIFIYISPNEHRPCQIGGWTFLSCLCSVYFLVYKPSCKHTKNVETSP